MVPPAIPPPLPGRSRSRLWLSLALVVGVVFLAAVIGAGVVSFQRVKQRAVAQRQALKELNKSADEIRARTAQDIKEGRTENTDASLGQLRDVLGKTASQLRGPDADAARAMGNFLGRLQEQMRDYNAAAGRFSDANVFTFDLPDRTTIEPQRVIVRDFLASNAQLTELMTHSIEKVRAELEAAKVPAAIRESTLAGFNRSQAALRPLQLQIRRCDETLGNSALEALDLLDKNWGKWQRDPATTQLRFQDDTTLATYNALMIKVQETAAEQAQAQQEMAAKMQSQQSTKTP